jgi:hypothetical protein
MLPMVGQIGRHGPAQGVPLRLWIDGVLFERLTDDETGQYLTDDDTNEPLYDEVA